MRLRTLGRLTLIAAMGAATGCAGGQSCRVSAPAATYSVLPETEPRILDPDLSASRSTDAVQLANALTGREVAFRGLTPNECQCLAVDASPLGDLLSAERRTVASKPGPLRHGLLHQGDQHRAAVERRMLYYAAQEARNRSAGDALRIYWGLVQAEHSQPLLAAGHAEATAAVKDLDELLSRGLAVPVDGTLLRMQVVKLSDRDLELDLTIERLNEQLKPMLDLDGSDTSWHIWPETELKLVVEPIDLDAAVAEGLQLRPELRLLRMLSANLDSDTLPAARRALGAIHGALGSSESSCCGCLAVLKLPLCNDSACEEAARRRQLAQYRADREAAIASEIRQGAHAVATAAARVSLADEQRELRAKKASALEAKLPTGGANAFELRQARLDVIDARREAVAQFAAWQTARVELRQAQGKLVDECRSGNCP